jgi:ABC-2 type transport system permease protein
MHIDAQLFTVLLFVFTRVFKLGGNIPFYPVYLLLGIVIWTFFAEITVSCLLSIVGKGPLIRKIYFPRIILIISNSFTSLLTFLSNLVVVFVFMVGFKVVPTWHVVFIPLVIIELYLFVVGIGLILSSLYVKFRDISHIWEVVLQALFYATPILYSPAIVPDAYKPLMMLSPIAQIIQDFRYLLITDKAVTAWQVLQFPYYFIPYVLPFIIFIIGYIIFEKMAAKFAEEV